MKRKEGREKGRGGGHWHVAIPPLPYFLTNCACLHNSCVNCPKKKKLVPVIYICIVLEVTSDPDE